MARSEAKERPLPVSDHLRPFRGGDPRSIRAQVTVGPNAPQLIRLVRHPFALATVRPCRVDGGDLRRERLGQVALAELVSPRTGRWDHVRSHSPLKAILRGPSVRGRPSIDLWLGLRDGTPT